MALIQHGSFEAFSVNVAAPTRDDHPALCALNTLADVREATRVVQPVPLEFEVSTERRGLALKSLKLTQGFEGFVQDLFNPTNEVYFLAWSWDLSGNPIVKYPGTDANASTCIIPLRGEQVREFLGAGIVLFPARRVTAGLATRIMLWESDQDSRHFGKAMSEVANTIRDSKLSSLLSLVSLAAGATGVTVSLVKDAATELADAIGKILQANSNDYVDLYEGYYPVSESWTSGDETHQGNASEISLTRLV